MYRLNLAYLKDLSSNPGVLLDMKIQFKPYAFKMQLSLWRFLLTPFRWWNLTWSRIHPAKPSFLEIEFFFTMAEWEYHVMEQFSFHPLETVQNILIWIVKIKHSNGNLRTQRLYVLCFIQLRLYVLCFIQWKHNRLSYYCKVQGDTK